MVTFTKPIRTIVGLFLCILSLSAIIAKAPYPPGNASRQEQGMSSAVVRPEPLLRLIVPAYFEPRGDGKRLWDRLIKAARRAPLTVIVNVNTGPGTVVDLDYKRVITEAVAAGLTVIGYVNTDYTKRPAAAIQADIKKWHEFYPNLQGIFLDAQASTPDKVSDYLAYRKMIEEAIPGGVVITNPGTVCSIDYFQKKATDLACVFELPENYPKFLLPAWASKFPRSQFAAIPYRIGTEKDMKIYLMQSVKKGIGCIYVTDASGINPWNRLPVYWESEVEAVHRINQHQAP